MAINRHVLIYFFASKSTFHFFGVLNIAPRKQKIKGVNFLLAAHFFYAERFFCETMSCRSVIEKINFKKWIELFGKDSVLPQLISTLEIEPKNF